MASSRGFERSGTAPSSGIVATELHKETAGSGPREGGAHLLVIALVGH
jgi:hypothetical protein